MSISNGWVLLVKELGGCLGDMSRWYRVKVTVRWEDSENTSFGIPARVVQYEATTAVILKFELIYAPTIENGADLEASLDASSAAIHEFQFLLSSYRIAFILSCPFDALHAVLVDVSVHVSLLEAASYSSASKLPSNSADTEVIIDRSTTHESRPWWSCFSRYEKCHAC
ncbi:FAM135A protein [Spatholobus suberectus]|nr:FAM135A protein [Spatholobus suberectus]